MLGKAPTLRLASILFAAGVVFAMPVASAFGMGIDAGSVNEMKNAGAKPLYGQTWAGHWMEKYGWGGFEEDLRVMRDAGVTPVVMWYYWGDDISPDCVKYGCAGRTKAEWDSMAKTMATRAASILGTRQFYVVVEPEFNKQGIKEWETFDGYLESQVKLIRGIAPSADFVAGFGHWGGWDNFDRYVAQCDLVGFQVLRGSTRDSASTAEDTADYMISLAKTLKARWGKPIMVFDLGIATYGGWNEVQERALDDIIAKRSALDGAGIKAIIWRYVYDNDHSSGYFGAAESTWGVKYAGGGKKPAYEELVTLIQGGTSSTTTTTTSPTTSTGTSGFDATFSGVKVQEWWVQASVTGTESISQVDARVNGGSWQALTKQSWGGYAKSIHVGSADKVEFRATSSSGATDLSSSYARTDLTGTTGSTTTSSFDATFTEVKIQEYWVQADVAGTQSISKVDARVNGGSWQALTKQSYGWSKSIHVLSGQKVEFRATSSTGATDVSSGYYR